MLDSWMDRLAFLKLETKARGQCSYRLTLPKKALPPSANSYFSRCLRVHGRISFSYPGGFETRIFIPFRPVLILLASVAQHFRKGDRKTPFCLIYWAVCLVMIQVVSAYEPPGRWGQAATIFQGALVVHGGKVDQLNQFSYTAAPNVNDVLYLPLSCAFSVDYPPWQLISNASDQTETQGPAISWHTLSPFNSTHSLVFGGLPDPNSETANLNAPDSAVLLDLTSPSNPQWQPQTASWAGQPNRRIRHSAVTVNSGKVYICGGEKADGSQNALAEYFVFNDTLPSFTALSTPPKSPSDLYGHSTVVLGDGRIVLLGGYSQSAGALVPLTTVQVLDVSQMPPTWTTVTTASSVAPAPRIAFASTSLPGNRILIHGGSDFDLQVNMYDGWILDMTSMVWSKVEALSQIGSRRDHFAVTMGNQTIFGFGYQDNGPAPSALQVFDFGTNSFVKTFTPISTTIQTIPAPNTTPGSVVPTQTSTAGTSGGATPSEASNPTNGQSGGKQDSRKRNILPIVVGVVGGLVAFHAIVIAVLVYYRRRRRNTSGEKGAFVTLSSDDNEGQYPRGISATQHSAVLHASVSGLPNVSAHILPIFLGAFGKSVYPKRTKKGPGRYAGLAAMEEVEGDGLQPPATKQTQEDVAAEPAPSLVPSKQLPETPSREATTDPDSEPSPLKSSSRSHHLSIASRGSDNTIQALRRTVRFSHSSYPDEPALSDTVSQILGNPSRQASINDEGPHRQRPTSSIPSLPLGRAVIWTFDDDVPALTTPPITPNSFRMPSSPLRDAT